MPGVFFFVLCPGAYGGSTMSCSGFEASPKIGDCNNKNMHYQTKTKHKALISMRETLHNEQVTT